MGFFVEKVEAIENRKKYLVYKFKPASHYILLLFILVPSILAITITSFGKNLNNFELLIVYTFWIIFFVLIIIMAAETWEGSLAMFRNKQIIKKGSTKLSFSHPLETWIEK